MTVYLDSDFRCYTTNSGDRTPYQTDFFDGKCKTFVEGYRIVPSGESWAREDGVIFFGEMTTPFIDSAFLNAAQAQYEEDQAQMSDMQNALEILGVTE